MIQAQQMASGDPAFRQGREIMIPRSPELTHKPRPGGSDALREPATAACPILADRVQTHIRVQNLIRSAYAGNTDTLTAISQRFGRRKGDAVLLAFSYACERGDLDVAAQLLIEYEGIETQLPPSLNADRRVKSDNAMSVVRHLWLRLRMSLTG